MKRLVLSLIAAFMLLTSPQIALAAGGSGDNDGMRSNQYVNRFNDTDANANMNRRGMTGAGTNAYTGGMNRMNTNDDWDNTMTTRTLNDNNRTVRANAANDNTDWGWLGLLGLIGLAGLMGRGRERGDEVSTFKFIRNFTR